MEKKIDDNGDYTASTASLISPSFSTYSGDNLVKIAERVGGDHYKEKEDDEFEFATVHEPASSLVFPVFHQKPEDVSLVTPLKDLFLREKEQSSPHQTYSSSDEEEEEEEEEDEMDTIPSEIYCPWTPARSLVEMSPCRKSKSTGSSSTSSWSKRRWRIRNLLKRSRSDGKETLEFLNSSPVDIKDKSCSSSSPCPSDKETVKTKNKKKEKEKEKVSAHEKFYLRNKAMKEEDKRKSYLPYKQELVGLFSNIHRHGKVSSPF